jgi:YHS domain-containing protein
MRFVAGIAAGVAPERTQRPPQQVMGHMVKDPVCGTYVVEGRALTAARNGQTAWFCSPECQHAWLQGKAS